MQKDDDNDDWIWDRYWHHDRIASCYDYDAADRNYPKEVRREWQTFLDTLPGDAKILDLCTGNGAVARIAAEFAVKNDRDFSIIGVDRANIDPVEFVQATKGQDLIDFIGGVAAEDLPFPKAAFDAAISQYGFEYTNKDAAAGALATVLKPGANAKLICHAAEGVPAENSTSEIAVIRTVTEDLKLFEAAREATALAWKAENAQGDAAALFPAATEKMQAFRDAMNEMSALASENPDSDFLTGAYGLLQHTFGVRSHFPLETLIEKINETEAEALAHLGRLQALIDASLSEDDCRALGLVLESHGFGEVSFAPFHVEEGAKLAGWTFTFRRLAK